VIYKLRGLFCHCREISAETERESQQLQNYWSEVRYMVRCIYRQAGTPLADDQDQSLVPDKEGMKELVDRYSTSKNYLLIAKRCFLMSSKLLSVSFLPEFYLPAVSLMA